MRNMIIIQKLGNKFWLQIAGVVVVLTAIVLAVVFWPANDSHKAKTGISEKEKRAKIIQAYRDKNRKLSVPAEPLAERSDSGISEVAEDNQIEKIVKPVNLAEVLAARKNASRDKSEEAALDSFNNKIKELLAEKIGNDFFEIRSGSAQVTGDSRELAANLTERPSQLSQTRQTPSRPGYLNHWLNYWRRSRQDGNSGLRLEVPHSPNTSGAQNLRTTGDQSLLVAPVPMRINIQPPKVVGHEGKVVRIEEIKNAKVIDANGLKVYKPQESQK